MDAPKIIQYTEEFLRKFRDVKYDVPESIKQSDLYIHAPKPQVNRPRVDRSRSKDGKTKNFLSAAERQELQRRRKDDEKKKQEDFKEGGCTPVKSPIRSLVRSPATPQNGEGSASEEVQATSEDDTDIEGPDTTATFLQDAQEQQLVLSVPDPIDGPGSANKPETRSLLSRSKKPLTVETDERRLAQRLKQVEFGKVTHGYKCYLKSKPKEKRTKHDPQTPMAAQTCSKRSWDGQVRKWRRQLHRYDDLFPISETGGTLGNDVPASDSEDAVSRPLARAVPSPSKAPTVSKEERDALARMRKEMRTPQKALPKEEGEEVQVPQNASQKEEEKEVQMPQEASLKEEEESS